MKNKVGRPSKYSPEMLKETEKYLEEAVPENMDLPMVEGLAIRLNVSKQALYRWAKKHKDFRNALRRLKMLQKLRLAKIGIYGGKEINATIVALMLRVNHKMVETTKQDITSKGEKVLVMPSELVKKYDIDEKPKNL